MEELGGITLRHKGFMIRKIDGLFIDLFVQSVNIHECLHQAKFYAWRKRYVSDLKRVWRDSHENRQVQFDAMSKVM